MGNPNNTNPKYNDYLKIWQKCQDATDGQEAIKAKTDNYLLMLPGQKADLNDGSAYYQDYLDRAVWYGATGRTVDVLRGLPFRKEPTFEVPQSMEIYIEKLTSDSMSAVEVSKELIRECIIKNRVGVMVDYPDVSTDGMSVADVKALNLRPYVSIYTAETILDWREDNINNEKITTFVSLLESCKVVDSDDEFNYIDQYRVRILDLIDGVYRVRIFEQVDNDKFELISENYPIIDGSVLGYIPFYPITGDGETWKLRTPIINDLANLNIAHFNNDASYRNGTMMSGNPTPCFKGLDIDKSKDRTGKIRMGSNSSLHFDTDGEAWYLQVGTDGFGEINRAAKDLQDNMSTVGSRILGEEKKAAESSETTAMKYSGENSILADMVNSVSGVMTKILRLIYQWENGQDDESIFYQINTDFLALPIDPTLLTSMMATVQGGLMSPQTFFYNLERGELLPPGADFETEKENISNYIGVGGESLDDEV